MRLNDIRICGHLFIPYLININLFDQEIMSPHKTIHVVIKVLFRQISDTVSAPTII